MLQLKMLLDILRRVFILIAASAVSLFDSIIGQLKQAGSFALFRTSRMYPRYLQSGNATSFCRHHAAQYCKGKGLDIGPGRWALENARGIENTNKENATKILEDDNSQDFVFSSHCLEHIADWRAALDEWSRVLRPNGILYLYLPHPACEMWHHKVNPFHKWDMDPHTVKKGLLAGGYEILDMSWFPDSYLSFYVVARKGKNL